MVNRKNKNIILTICIIVAVVATFGIIEMLEEPSNKPLSGSIATESSKQKDYSKLVGNWIRQTGGYVITINKVSADGQADAGYFNPRSIHVSQATASNKNGELSLFIELRDQGYPGSTYTLKYNPEYDALVGVYFQAAMQQSFDVAFTRKQ